MTGETENKVDTVDEQQQQTVSVPAAGSGEPEVAQTNCADQSLSSPTEPATVAVEQAPLAPDIPQGHGELVLVVGAESFVGAHVVSQLLQSGQFRVRAAVSDLTDEVKAKVLRDLVSPDATYFLEIVEANLSKPESWDVAVKDCEFVVLSQKSVAQATDPSSNVDDVIKETVNGMNAVLKAAHAAKTVKRVVLTSSISAITQGHGESKKKFTEDDWTVADKAGSTQSKCDTLVEQAAWTFVKELPENEKLELVTINPGYMLGPSLTAAAEENGEFEVIKRLLNREVPMLPRLNFNVVDVRDVALAHVRALTLPVAGARHILVSHNVWLREIAVILSREFRKQGYCVPTTQAPYFVVWMKAQFDSSVKPILPLINSIHEADNKRMKEALYIQPRDLKDTVIDTASSLIAKEVVKKMEKKPSRRFSLRRVKKEEKEEAATTDAEQPLPDGSSEDKKSEKKKTPKKKSEKKKKEQETVNGTAVVAAAVDGAPEGAAGALSIAATEPETTPTEFPSSDGQQAPANEHVQAELVTPDANGDLHKDVTAAVTEVVVAVDDKVVAPEPTLIVAAEPTLVVAVEPTLVVAAEPTLVVAAVPIGDSAAGVEAIVEQPAAVEAC